MFTKTRLTLTAWYLLIIMLISLAFSLVIYRGAESELQRSLRIQSIRFQREQGIFLPPGIYPQINTDLLTELDDRIKLTLILVNLGILGFSGAAGYFLAGKTLKPIERMLTEQKRFVADASHELRTPLTAMRTEIEVAMRDKKLNLIGAKRLLKSNLEETDKMQKLSNYLLTLSKYQTTNSPFKKEPLDLASIIQTVIDKYTLTASQKNLQLISKARNIMVEANKESLLELINILVDNAIKYSRPKGKIVISTDKTGSSTSFSVHDNGIGIDPFDLPHIFDRFYRADSSRSKSKTDGYGLGLSIAKEIVDHHGGTINVESSLKAGTTFKVKL
jgi:signal transduction histidine kinase